MMLRSMILLLAGLLLALVPTQAVADPDPTRFTSLWVGAPSDVPDVTCGDNDLYVKGTLEVDGAARFDAAQTFNGSVTLGDASADTVTVNADTVSLTDGSVLKVETLQFVDSTGIIVKDGSLSRITISTNGNPDDSDVSVAVKDGANSTVQTLLLWDDGNNYSSFSAAVRFTGGLSTAGDITASADNARTIGASGTEFATIWVQSIDDGDGTVDVAAALTADSITIDANADSAVSGTGAHKGAYIEASDGTTAITITDSTAACAFAGSVTLGDATGDVVTINADTVSLTDASKVKLETIYPVDTTGIVFADASAATKMVLTTNGNPDDSDLILTINDGSGASSQVFVLWDDGANYSSFSSAVRFTGGISVAGDITASADNAKNIGASGTEFATAWLQAIDDGDGTVDVDAALTITGVTLSMSNVAAVANIGSASSTTGSQLSLFDGGSDNKPGAVAIYQDDGAATWIFARSSGALAVHTAYPTDDDADGNTVCTFADNAALETDSIPYAGTTTPEGLFWTTDGSAPVTDVAVMGSGATAANDALYVFKNGKWRTVTLAD